MRTDDLARMAARAAARVRADLGVGPAEGVCPFDIAEGLEVPVRLVPLPSLEGMYSPEPRPTILVSAERPPGRRRYTCGHEIGHHVFGHGTRLDELREDLTVDTWNPDEFVAQRFAAALMMPKLAINSAFAKRGWSVADVTPEMIFVVAQELGVGFTTLIAHLERTLRLLSPSVAEEYRRVRLPKLRERLAGFEVEHDLVVVDQHWGRRTVDLEVGDVVVLPMGAEVIGACASVIAGHEGYWVACSPGIGAVSIAAGRPELSLRVSRRAFTGLARYRHLEDVADGE
ncbi:MAG: ImmA/IrrE family metallo-endopeptidase [Planctomycetota bacterium]|nr:ImmA/IrrE family metallo-endopeptidase [Planctomycetota bacterium]